MIHLFSNLAFAATPKYGPEFTFLVNLNSTSFPFGPVAALRELILKACPECAQIDHEGPGRTFLVKHNGYEFKIKVDADPSVCEVTATKQSTAGWKALEDWFEKRIFNFIKAQNYKPHEWIGAGHINIGVESFESAEHMQKFIIQFMKHPEIANVFGEMAYDSYYAHHIFLLEDTPKKLFLKNIVGWKRNLAKSDWENRVELLKLLAKAYDSRTDLGGIKKYGDNIDSEINRRKYTALAPRYDYGDPDAFRLEVRTSRPQKNMKEWIKQLEFFDRFIEYSKSQTTAFDPFQNLDGNMKRNLEKFAELLQKLNLNPDDYDFMIKKSWRKNWNTAKLNLGTGQCVHLFN